MATLHSRTQGSRRWERVRAHQLRKEPLCKFCLDHGRVTPATIADHTVPWKRGLPDDAMRFWTTPLQSLCKRCHDSLKKQVEFQGYHRGINNQGFPIDPNHPFNKPRLRSIPK